MRRSKKPRDWNAVDAHFRNSAGAMKELKHTEEKYKCRDWRQKWRSKYANIEEEVEDLESIWETTSEDTNEEI